MQGSIVFFFFENIIYVTANTFLQELSLNSLDLELDLEQDLNIWHSLILANILMYLVMLMMALG